MQINRRSITGVPVEKAARVIESLNMDSAALMIFWFGSDGVSEASAHMGIMDSREENVRLRRWAHEQPATLDGVIASEGSALWHTFEDMWSTTCVIYPINDGTRSRYRQETPKQRILAYLRALSAVVEKTT